MEIERKYLVKTLPENLENYECKQIAQGYLCTSPVVRIRREDDAFYLTYKGKGMMAREEYNLPLNKDSYYHLLEKADGNIISKKRYLIPLKNPQFTGQNTQPPEGYSLTIELDVFAKPFAPLIMAEVEFGSKIAAETFLPPDWFLEDVTYDPAYHNSYLSKLDLSVAR